MIAVQGAPDTALEPLISANTLSFHYGKHHKTYVDNLNKLVAGTELADLSLEKVIAATAGQADKAGIFNNAAQIWNHDFYWRSMHPDGGGAPSGALNDAITRDFGGFEHLRKEFLEAGANHFGSGWVWLVLHGDSLLISTTHDADLPGQHGDTAILCADLWEHAYYLDYHDERARYLETFVDHLANWEFAEANWSTAAAGSPILRRASR